MTNITAIKVRELLTKLLASYDFCNPESADLKDEDQIQLNITMGDYRNAVCLLYRLKREEDTE